MALRLSTTLKQALRICSMKVRIHNYTWIGNEVEIGDGSKVQAFAFIPNGVIIGKNVFIGPHVCFTNDLHPHAQGEWKQLGTLVKDNASIGANATILPGITIGKGAMIGAGSIVTKDVPDGATWIGTGVRNERRRTGSEVDRDDQWNH